MVEELFSVSFFESCELGIIRTGIAEVVVTRADEHSYNDSERKKKVNSRV